MKIDLLSKTHHEMGGLLTIIKEGLSIVLDGTSGSLNDEQKRFLDMAKKNVNKMVKLSDDVFFFQKLASEKIEFNMKKGDISKIVEDIKKAITPMAEEKGLRLVAESDSSFPEMVFDGRMISRAISGIVINAVESSKKGSVKIAAGYKNNQVQVLIDGINNVSENEEILDFAIAKEIVEEHGGKTWTELKPDKSLIFNFTIPVAQDVVG